MPRTATSPNYPSIIQLIRHANGPDTGSDTASGVRIIAAGLRVISPKFRQAFRKRGQLKLREAGPNEGRGGIIMRTASFRKAVPGAFFTRDEESAPRGRNLAANIRLSVTSCDASPRSTTFNLFESGGGKELRRYRHKLG